MKNQKFYLLFTIVFLLVMPIKGAKAEEGLKVFISVDMEGLAGVVAHDHVVTDGQDYQMARNWATQEANAAIRGALEAGATEIVINDSHGQMRNIIADKLNPAARLITGSPKPLGMMQGIDETFDAAIFIGYHARAGSKDGALNHTYSSSSVYSLRVNGQEVGESEFNAMLAGHFNVPVVMIAGDQTLCKQVKDILGKDLVTTEVKKSIGRSAANTLVPSKAQEKIKENTRVALEKLNEMEPLKQEPPYSFEIDFLYSNHAQAAELVPGVSRKAPRTVEYTQEDLIEGVRLFRALLSIARQ